MGLTSSSTSGLNGTSKQREISQVTAGGNARATYSATTGSPTVTTVDGKTCVQFTGSGTITIDKAGLANVMVVSGGGGGGGGFVNFCNGGGGGSGSYVEQQIYLPVGTWTIQVGGGGNAQPGNTSTPTPGRGTPSWFQNLISGIGGGNGGFAPNNGTLSYGGTGGGGGGGNSNQGTGAAGGAGFAGLAGSLAGGGSSTAASTNTAGSGTASSITGASVTRAAGGGAGLNPAVSGPANSGNGGSGGAAATNTPGGAGGSGIVILVFG